MTHTKYETAMAQRRGAIKKNYTAFKKQVSRLAETHAGQYALLRNAVIIEYYPTAVEAIQAAAAMYPNDVRYSIEKIQEEPIYMGMYAGVAR